MTSSKSWCYWQHTYRWRHEWVDVHDNIPIYDVMNELMSMTTYLYIDDVTHELWCPWQHTYRWRHAWVDVHDKIPIDVALFLHEAAEEFLWSIKTFPTASKDERVNPNSAIEYMHVCSNRINIYNSSLDNKLFVILVNLVLHARNKN